MFFIFLFLVILTVIPAAFQGYSAAVVVSTFDGLIFFIWFGYFIYWTVKKTRSCYGYYKAYRAQGLNNTTNYGIDDAYRLQDIIDDNIDYDWIADRMINPQNYNEQHSSFTPYELYKTSSNENDETNN